MPPPRPATEVSSGSLEPGRAGPGLISQYTPSSHPAAYAAQMYATDVRQTDVRQHHLLMPPWAGA